MDETLNLLPIDQPPQSRSIIMGLSTPKKKPSPDILYENVLLIKMFTSVGRGGGGALGLVLRSRFPEDREHALVVVLQHGVGVLGEC